MRYVHKCLLAISVLLSFAKQSYAQLFYNKGFIVTSGDTIPGEIRERTNQAIDFRRSSGSSSREYSPDQIAGYYLEDDKQIANSLTFSEAGQTKTCFMHEQVSGYVGLYSLVKPDGNLTHLIRLPTKTVVPLRGNLALLMLTNHLTECKDPAFTRLLNPQTFRNSNDQFGRIVKTYNACVSPGQSQKTVKKRFHYELGVLAGVAQNSWNYGAVEDRMHVYWNPNGRYSARYTGTVGGYFTFAPHKKLSFDIELFYTGYQGNRVVRVDNPLEPNANDTRLYSFSERYLSLPLAARYSFGQRRVRWFLKAGIVPVYETDVRGIYSGDNIVDADIPIKEAISFGYLAGAGASFRLSQKKNLYVEVRIIPHLVVDGATRIGSSRSLQLTVRLPLIVN